MSTISAITTDLATTKKDLVDQFQFSYATEEETQKLKDVAEKQLNQVRSQLYTHTVMPGSSGVSLSNVPSPVVLTGILEK